MQTTTRNADLGDLAALLKQQQARKVDVVASAGSIRCENGLIIVEGAGDLVPDPDAGFKEGPGVFRPTSVFDEGLAEKLNIPVAYLRKLRAERVDLYDLNVNGWLHGHADAGPDPRSFLVRCFKGDDGSTGVARAFLSDTYKRIDNLDVLTAALNGVRESGTEIEVVSCDLTDRRMYVKIAAPGIAVLAPHLLDGYRNPVDGRQPHWGFEAARREGRGYEPGKEPVVFAGFEISNSETGGGASSIIPRLIVQICGNGLKIQADALRAVHLGGKLDEGQVKWSDETQERQLALITSRAKDAVKTFLDADYVRRTILNLEAKAGTPIANPAEDVRKVGKALSFTEETISGVLDHFIRGGQVTAGGVMQAITSFAQQVEDADAAADLEGQAVKALELAAAL